MIKLLAMLFMFVTVQSFSHQVFACTSETINGIVSPINPYKNDADLQLSLALETLSLCDENLAYAGYLCGTEFNPYETRATQKMSEVVIDQITEIPEPLAQGLGEGVIHELNLYQYNSTIYMLRSIIAIGTAYPQLAKGLALKLLQHQNAYEKEANNQLLKAVSVLRNLAKNEGPVDSGNSIWSFRSQNRQCDFVTGPWGRYEICPSYFASIADRFGNRLVLTCDSETSGIEMRINLGSELWSKVSNSTIQTMSFGTEDLQQAMGVPYVIEADHALLAEEPLAEELIHQLKYANRLSISVRANSGELNHKLHFSLKGSNVAIKKLQALCE